MYTCALFLFSPINVLLRSDKIVFNYVDRESACGVLYQETSIEKIYQVNLTGLETYRDDHTLTHHHLTHRRAFPTHLTVIIGKNLLSSSFIFKPKMLQNFTFLQWASWFCSDSQKTNMPRSGGYLKALEHGHQREASGVVQYTAELHVHEIKNNSTADAGLTLYQEYIHVNALRVFHLQIIWLSFMGIFLSFVRSLVACVTQCFGIWFCMIKCGISSSDQLWCSALSVEMTI